VTCADASTLARCAQNSDVIGVEFARVWQTRARLRKWGRYRTITYSCIKARER
jgi:hypothetical protein